MNTLRKATGVTGILGVLCFLGPGIAINNSAPEPDGTGQEVVYWITSRDTPLWYTVAAAWSIGMVIFIVHASCWGSLIAAHEDAPAWRGRLVGILGAWGLGIPLAVPFLAAAYRSADIDPQVARLAFDLGNVAFSNAWICLGGFGIALAYGGVATRLLPRWSGLILGLAGLGLVASRFAWPAQIGFAPYMILWAWVLVTSIGLLRAERPGSIVAEHDALA